VLFSSECLGWIQTENREHLLLEGGLPPILVIGVGQSRALRVLSIIDAFERVVDITLYNLFQLNVRLFPGQDFTYPSAVILQQVLVYGERDLQPVDERECRYIFTAVEKFDQLVSYRVSQTPIQYWQYIKIDQCLNMSVMNARPFSICNACSKLME